MFDVTYKLDGNIHENRGLYDSVPTSWQVGKMVDLARGRGRYPTFATITSIKPYTS